MRFTIQIRPLLLGLPILVSQAFVVAPPVAGWEWNVFGSADNAPATPAKPPVANNRAIAPTTPRWTDGAVQNAYAQGEQQSGAVQQTAHTGPSRSGTLIGSQDASHAGGSGAPTWHGQSLRTPTKLFSRGGNSTKPASMNPVSKKIPGAGATTAGARQGSATATAAGRPLAIPAPWSPAGATPYGASRVAANQPATAPSRPATLIKQSTTHQAQSTTTKHEPALAKSPEPQLAETAPAAMVAKTPGDQLILKAHEFSGRASTEEDFSRIIETCRRARASQLSPQLNDFANQLSAWSLNRRGQLKAEAGHTKEAILDFNDAIRSDPTLWRALHNRGVLKAQAGDFESAFDDFNLTIQFNSKFAKAYSNRAALFVVAGDPPSALDDYAHAIKLDPNLAVAHRGRARLCHQLGRLDEALDHFDAAVQLTPDDAYAIAGRADLLTDLGRYVDAAKGYDRAIKLDPKSASAVRGSAWLLATCPDSSVRDANLAVERAEQAIQLEGQEESVGLDTLAAALASAGDFSAAMQTMRQAIEMAPDNERDVYQDRLKLYERAKPYRIEPVRGVAQVSYEGK
jgi:tetratricopeptide (TPR) repeat protein